MEEKISDVLGPEPKAEQTAAPIPEAKPEPQAQAAPTDQTQAERARDERGRYAKQTSEPTQTEEPGQPEKKQDDSAFAAMRRRIEALEKQNKELAERGQPQQPTQDQQQYQPQSPEERSFNERLNVSERFARIEHGAELVEEAKAWFKTLSAQEQNEIRTSADPYETLVIEYEAQMQAESVLGAMGKYDFDLSDPESLDAWAVKRANELAAQRREQVAQSQKPASAPPPASIVHAPSAGRTSQPPVMDGQGMADDIFKGR